MNNKNKSLTDEKQAIVEAISAKIAITQKKVLSTPEAAAYMNCSLSYLYKLTMQGKIPFSRPLGKMMYFNREELEQWLMSNRQSTAAELQDSALKYCSHTRTRIVKKGGQNE